MISTSTDPAGVLGAAMSLVELIENDAVLLREMVDHYAGFDGVMRAVMDTAERFEGWSLERIDFAALDHVWPYLLREKFGSACAECPGLRELLDFSAADCLRVAMGLRLPLRYRDGERMPLDLRLPHPAPSGGAGFIHFQVQTMRLLLREAEMVAYVCGDDPECEDHGDILLRLSGVDDKGALEPIRDFHTLAEAEGFLSKLFGTGEADR